MLISEVTFPHLMAERDARLTRELEWRRVAIERIESESERGGSGSGERSAAPARAARRRWHLGSRDARWDSTLRA